VQIIALHDRLRLSDAKRKTALHDIVIAGLCAPETVHKNTNARVTIIIAVETDLDMSCSTTARHAAWNAVPVSASATSAALQAAMNLPSYFLQFCCILQCW
jgi:hypothetical protein